MLDLSNLRRPTTRRCQNYANPAYYYHFRDERLQIRDLRCTAVPTHLLTQRLPDPDGHHGQMAVCSRCLVAATHDLGPDFFTSTEIDVTLQLHAEARADRVKRGLTRRQAKDEVHQRATAGVVP